MTSDLAEDHHESAEAADPPPDSASSPRSRRAVAYWTVAVAAAFGSLAWIVAAAVGAGHGLDFSDEGFYLLSYRWWSVDLRNFTGAQFVYGPVFQLLGYDIQLLRLFRLLTVIAAHLTLGLAVLRWLDTFRPIDAPLRRPRAMAVGALILAGGGFVYTWLPSSPGYNDVALLGSLVLAALTIGGATRIANGRTIPWWTGALMGAVALVMVLSKWSSAAVCVVAVAVAWITMVRSWRPIARIAAFGAAGALAVVAFIQLAVVDLTTALPLLAETNRAVGRQSNSVTGLAEQYLRTSLTILREGAALYPLVLLTPLILALLSPRFRRYWPLLATVGLATTAAVAVRRGSLLGGADNLADSMPLVMVLLLFPLITLLAARIRQRIDGRGAAAEESATAEVAEDAANQPVPPGRHPGWITPVVLLFALPFCQAAGTGNPILMLAVHGGACWIAASLILASTLEDLDAPTATLLALGAVVTAGVGVSLGTTGALHYPYRAYGPVNELTRRSVESPALGSLRLAPRIAEDLDQLQRLLRPSLQPPGRRIMAFNEAAGIVLAMDGRSVGEAWYSGVDAERTAQAIKASCPGGVPPWGDRRPLVIVRLIPGVPSLKPEHVLAMNYCGMRFPDDYAPIGRSNELEIIVFGPR